MSPRVSATLRGMMATRVATYNWRVLCCEALRQRPAMRSLPVCRLLSLRSGDTDQSLRTELVNQVEQILLQALRSDLVLVLHDLKHLL
jgi:hypothetical protein